MPRKAPAKKAEPTPPVVSDEVVLEGADFLVLQTATTTGDDTKKEYTIVIEENAYDGTAIVRVPEGNFERFKRFLRPQP